MTDKLAEDWVALWQSELTAMAADREMRESWAAMVAIWAGAATAAFGLARGVNDSARRNAGAVEPAGASASFVASKPGVDEVERLNHRIADLEHRLAAIERNRDSAAD